MKRSWFICRFGNGAICRQVSVVFWLLALVVAGRGTDQKPNIVFILADDLGVNDLSGYGRQEHLTPHLNQLAAQGVRFTTAYCAQPICSPTRAALMTGKTPARLHLTTYLPGRGDAPSQMLLHPSIEQQLPLAEQTIAEILREAGYRTACIGKWHLGDGEYGPAAQGFDFVFPGKANTSPSREEGGKGEYELTSQAEEFIFQNKERPFFLYLAHNSPHVPLAAKRELIVKNSTAYNPIYAAMMETLDECVGRILSKLDSLSLQQRTIVIFTSDNGGLHVFESPNTPSTHNAPFRAGKGYLYEGGLRVPLLVRWPGKIKEGRVETAPVISTDWVPTLLEIAGLQIPADLDGVSLARLLRGPAELPARPLFWHFPHYTNQGGRPGGAIRDGEWKLIEHYESGRAELFHLTADESETTDLSLREPARTAEMRGKLAVWRQAVGAQENTPNPRFDPDLARSIYEEIDTSRLPLAASAAEQRERLSRWRNQMNAALKPRAAAATLAPVIVLQAKNATIDGKTLRYEPSPQKNTLGFWTSPDDSATWEFDATMEGRYEVQLLQGCAGGGSEVEISIGDRTLPMTVQKTGHFQNFVPVDIGAVTLAKGRHTLTVRPKIKRGAAVMDLRSVTLRPIGVTEKSAEIRVR